MVKEQREREWVGERAVRLRERKKERGRRRKAIPLREKILQQQAYTLAGLVAISSQECCDE